MEYKYIDGIKVPKTPEDYEQDKLNEEFAKRWLAEHPPEKSPEERISALESENEELTLMIADMLGGAL